MNRWDKHLLGCQRKGYQAFKDGLSVADCPYKSESQSGYNNHSSRNLAKQRRKYWLFGFGLAKKESE